MAHHSPPDDEDLNFFRNAMKDIKRIKQSVTAPKTVPKKKAHKHSSSKSVFSQKEYKIDTDSLPALLDPIEQKILAEDKLFFKRTGPQHKLIKQLIRGEIARSACLDLHGMTIEEARSEVVNFLIKCRNANLRCVQIIHGKGNLSKTGAKLKNHINYWLAQIPWVLAFSSAQNREGGTGAVYVLLAKISPSN